MIGGIKRFRASIKHALDGLRYIIEHERSFQIQSFGAIIVICTVIILPLETWEAILLILMTTSVLVLEILNTIFERISDALKPRMHPIVKDVKDMMAGAVLITSITAIIIAVMILWEYIVIIFFGAS